MGATTFYALPYPDPGTDVDVPRDIKALADRLELWKNGFTVPSGDVVVGAAGSTVGHVLRSLYMYGGAQYQSDFQVGQFAGKVGPAMMNYVAGGFRGALHLNEDNQLQTRDAGGVMRPIPFAMYADIKNITITSQPNNAITVTFPNGRFNATGTFPRPSVQVTPFGNVSYYGYSSGSGNASCSIGVCHRDATAASATVETHMMAIQMTPTLSPGRAAVESEPATRIAVCHTEECENVGIGIDVIDPGNDVFCGPCGNQIEDVVNASKKKRR